MPYTLIACTNCRHSEEIKIVHIDGITRIYICHNTDIKEYGILHAEFFECRLHEKDFLTQ